MSENQILTCYTTIGSEKDANELINRLLEEKCIACGVTWPANSFFEWQGKIDCEDEYVVYCKTSVQIADRFRKIIESIHPYDVPCLIYSVLGTNPPYCKWVNEQVSH